MMFNKSELTQKRNLEPFAVIYTYLSSKLLGLNLILSFSYPRPTVFSFVITVPVAILLSCVNAESVIKCARMGHILCVQ